MIRVETAAVREIQWCDDDRGGCDRPFLTESSVSVHVNVYRVAHEPTNDAAAYVTDGEDRYTFITEESNE